MRRYVVPTAWDNPAGTMVDEPGVFMPTVVVVPKKSEGVSRIAVGGRGQEARLPRQARIAGEVRLEAVIGVDGTVQQLRVANGHPLLSGAALEAVRQWRYQPTTLNGKGVEVSTVISVRFLLGGGA